MFHATLPPVPVISIISATEWYVSIKLYIVAETDVFILLFNLLHWSILLKTLNIEMQRNILDDEFS